MKDGKLSWPLSVRNCPYAILWNTMDIHITYDLFHDRDINRQCCMLHKLSSYQAIKLITNVERVQYLRRLHLHFLKHIVYGPSVATERAQRRNIFFSLCRNLMWHIIYAAYGTTRKRRKSNEWRFSLCVWYLGLCQSSSYFIFLWTNIYASLIKFNFWLTDWLICA